MPHLRSLSLATLVVLLASCATAPQRGVRASFKGNTVSAVAVAPLWSTTRLGMNADEWRAYSGRIERNIVDDLKSLGFRVIGPDALRDRLERRDAWDRFLDVMSFTDSIDRHFEPSLYDEPPLEAIALHELHEADALGAPTLLVAEVVYQSTADCTTDPRDFNAFAVVTDDSEEIPKNVSPGPCAITHFHAKLVDTDSGKTMWQNRQLRELRADEIDAARVERNATAAVDATLRGQHGLGPFAPSPNVVSASR